MKRCFKILILVILFMLFLTPVNAATKCRDKDENSCSGKEDGQPCVWNSNQKICRRDYPDVDSCAGFSTEKDCIVGKTKDRGSFGCAWNSEFGFCSVNGLIYLSCGSGDTIAYDIPEILPRLSSYAILILKTATPIILIIIGMIQLLKAAAAQSEEDMKKAKTSLTKKIIIAVMIFLVISIVQFIVKQVADDSEKLSTQACLNCFLNNDCGDSAYYTDGFGRCYLAKNPTKDVKCPVDKY